MIVNPDRYHAQLPLPATGKWKDGVWDVAAFRHGSMSLLYFAPQHADHRTPHSQDEWHFILECSGVIEIEGVRHAFAPGSAIFVGAKRGSGLALPHTKRGSGLALPHRRR